MLFLLALCLLAGALAGTYNFGEGDDPNCICVSEIPGWCKVNFPAHVNPSCIYPSGLPVIEQTTLTDEAAMCEAHSQCQSFQHRPANGVTQYCIEDGTYYRDNDGCEIYKQSTKCLPTLEPTEFDFQTIESRLSAIESALNQIAAVLDSLPAVGVCDVSVDAATTHSDKSEGTVHSIDGNDSRSGDDDIGGNEEAQRRKVRKVAVSDGGSGRSGFLILRDPVEDRNAQSNQLETTSGITITAR